MNGPSEQWNSKQIEQTTLKMKLLVNSHLIVNRESLIELSLTTRLFIVVELLTALAVICNMQNKLTRSDSIHTLTVNTANTKQNKKL